MRRLLTTDEVDDIIARYTSGESVATLAEKYGVHRSDIKQAQKDKAVAIRVNGQLATKRDQRRYWLTAKGEAVAGRVGGM